MKKLTFTNLVNGLSAEFSSESRTMHLILDQFDGSSVGASAIAYKPVDLDGQRLISTSLNARSVAVPVEFTAMTDGKYSRAGALAVWDKLLKVFSPLHEGWLVWSDGTNSRRIKCRAAETPNLTQVLPFLFSATFSLVADRPYWEDVQEHSVAVAASATAITINNACGLAAPFCVDVPASGSAPLIYNRTTGKNIAFTKSPGQACTVDTRECVVTLADGSFANHLLTVESEFFQLVPGNNELQILGTGGSDTAVIRWRDLFLGVY